MAYKTIGVKITGQAEVLAMTKLVNGLQKEVATVLKNIQTMGRQKPVAPFNVKLKIDTNDAVTQFIKLKRQLEKHTIDLKIKGVSSNTSSNNSVVKGLGELTKQADTAVVSLKELNTEASELAKPIKLGFIQSITKGKKELEETQRLLKELDKGFTKALSKNLGDETSKNAIQASNFYANLYARGITRNQNPNAFRTEFRHFFPKTDSGYISFEKHYRKQMLNQLKAFQGVDDEYVEAFRKALRIGDEFENVNINVDSHREALRQLRETISSMTEGYTKLISTAGRWAVLTPANAMLKSFMALNREIVNMNVSLGKGIGSTLTSTLTGALHQVKSFVSQTIGVLKTETAELGDAMEVYRLSMQSLGFSETGARLSMKHLNDYGKASVYDAKDLLALASNLYAYERTDAEEIVKAIAGLTAQTKNPQGNFNRVQTQLVQMMGAGVLNQQDWRYMRDAMNALGQSEVIDALEALAKQKGYRSVIEASRKRGITSEEVLDILKSIGNSEKFQNLVTSIITPKQAIANLKEALANLLVFDEIDENGKAVDGPLKNLYDSVTTFVKGITSVVSTPKFKEYSKNVGNLLGGTINGLTNLGKLWNKMLGASTIKSLEKFSSEFVDSLKRFNTTSNVVALTKELQELLNTSGRLVGNFATSSIKATIDLVREFIEVGNELAKGGILGGFVAVIDMYKSLAELSNFTGFTQAFAKQFTNFYQGLNRIITSPEVKSAIVPLVEALDKYLTVLFTSVEKFATKTNFIRSLSEVLTALVNTFTDIIEGVKSKTSASDFNKAFTNIKQAVIKLLEGLKGIYVEIISSVIQTAGTSTFKRFLDAVVDFAIELNEALVEFLALFGGGSAQKGLENILSFFTTLINVATNIVNKLGGFTFALPLIFRFGSWAISLIETLGDVNSALGELGFGGTLSKIFNTGYGDIVRSLFSKGKGLFSGGVGLASKTKSSLANLFKSNYDDIAKSLTKETVSPATKFLTGGKALGNALGQIGAKGLQTFSKSLGGATQALVKGVGTLKGTVIATLVNMGVGAINDSVQNSDASNTVKTWSQLGTSALSIGSWALTGASMGGPWGALIGGLVGTGLEAWNYFSGKDEREKQAKQEAMKISEEEKAMALEYVQSLAQSSRELTKSFYSSITKDTSIQSDFYNALSHVMGLSSQKGMSIMDTLKGLNVDVGSQQDLSSLDLSKTFVKLGDSTKSLKELQDETGLSVEELVGVLQYTFGTIGHGTTTLINEAGEVVRAVDTITEAEKARVQAELDKLNQKASQLGVASGYTNMTEVANSEKALDEVLSAKFNTVEEKQKAFAKALANGNVDLENQLLTYDVSILQEMADRAKQHLASTSISTEEHHAKLLEALTNTGKYTKEELAELEKLTVEELQDKVTKLEQLNYHLKTIPKLEKDYQTSKALQSLLPVIEGKGKMNGKLIEEYLDGSDVRTRKVERLAKELANSGGDTERNKRRLITQARDILKDLGIKDKELQERVVSKLLTGTSTLKEAIGAVAEDYGGVEEVKASLKTTKDAFVQHIIDNIGNGTLKLEDGIKMLEENGINIKNIDLSNIDEKGRETVEAMKEQRDKVVEKMDEQKKKSSGWLEEWGKNIGGFFKGIWDGLVDLLGGLLEGARNALFSNVPTNHLDNYVKNASVYSVGSGGGAVSSGRGSSAAFYSRGGFVSAFGNPIYRANGGTVGLSRGTDTVPAMLTEGEYVLRKQAVNSLGAGFLQKLNHEGARALQNLSGRTIITNVYNNNNAKINQNIDNKSQYLNGMLGMDRLMRFV